MALVCLDRGRSHALVQFGDVQRPTKSSSWFSVWIENHADHIEMYVDAVVSYQLELCDYISHAQCNIHMHNAIHCS